MVIVYLVSNIRKCGPLTVLNQIINNINNKNNDIYVISIFGNRDDQDILDEYKKKKINYYSLGLTSKDFILSGKKKLNQILTKIKPDVVNSHGIAPDLLLCNIKNFKKVSTLHSNITEDYINRFGRIKGKICIYFHIKALKKFDKVVAVANYISKILIKNNIKSVYIRNGIEINNYKNEKKIRDDVRKELTIPKDSVIYTFCGTLNQAKRVFELVNMFIENREENEYLIIMGDGSEKQRIKKIADDHVFMLGYVNNVFKYYIASDIYISNSSTEGFSMAVLEAISAHNLLLLSDIPSHNECININKNIYLGEVFNENNFKNKKKTVLKNIRNFDNRIIDEISDVKMSERYMKIYKE